MKQFYVVKLLNSGIKILIIIMITIIIIVYDANLKMVNSSILHCLWF